MVKDKNPEEFNYVSNEKHGLNYKIKNDPRLEKDKDLSGISWRQLNFGLWMAENRRNITRGITILLILISAFFFIYSSYSYVIYFLSGPIDNQTENQVLSPRNFITEMEIGSLEIFRNNNSYDLAIRLENSNDNFTAEFNYCFYQGETDLKCDKGFILPSEKKYLLALGINLSDSLATSFKIDDIFWRRINRREIPDWQEFFNQRINFEIVNVEFLNASRSGLSENIRLNSLEFNVINNSPYSYFNVPLNIFFYNGSSLVGVESHLAKDFITGENRSVKMSWPGDLGIVNRIEILPQINILDNDVYLRYRGGVQ